MNKDRLIALSLIILVAALSRILPHAPNFTPVAAIALFAGARFERSWLAFAVPFSALLISDAVLGIINPRPYPFSEMAVTYLAFGSLVGIGLLVRGSQRFAPLALATLSGAVVFFLITNCNFFVNASLYPQNFDGLMQGYVAGLPFFRNTLLSDVFYSVILFGGLALAERRYTWLRPVAAA